MKDHVTLLRAAALLIKGHDNVHFVLIGKGIDAGSDLADLAEALAIREHTHFMGLRNDVAELMPGFDVATLTSAYGEGFPNVVGEAMACGVPCVVTDVGDSAWLVADTGAVVQVGDVAGLAAQWAAFLDLPDDERTRLGERARKRIVEQFSLEAVVRQYETLYEHLCFSRERV
jgi:glycosyltransferase involved in cell wall biosynthesis